MRGIREEMLKKMKELRWPDIIRNVNDCNYECEVGKVCSTVFQDKKCVV
jgi:hypothetical protein